MATSSRTIEELNDLVHRLNDLIITLSNIPDEVVDPSAEDVEMEDAFIDQITQTEKDIQRKLMEIHSRLKNNANFMNFGDEESFFDDGEQTETDENLSRAERRRKVSSQQHKSDEDSEKRDAPRSPQMVPMSATSSMDSQSNRTAILTTDKASEVLRLCKIVFGCDYTNTTTEPPIVKRIPFTDETKALAAQLVAEMARSEVGRQLALQEGVISSVILVLDENDEAEENEKRSKRKRSNRCSLETAVQVCRILGNLCYDCPEGRKQVLNQEHSLERLSALAKSREERVKEDPGQRLPVILPGFLLNLCNDTAEAVEVVGKHGFVDVIVSNILSTKTNDAVFNASLNWLICLAEEIDSAKSHILNSRHLPDALRHILEFTTSPEVVQTVLELVRALIECPKIALHLVTDNDLFGTFLNHIIGKWQSSSEFEPLRADACELVVLFVSHEDCMKVLYSAYDKKYVTIFTEWLSSNNDPSLQVCAALSLGNFACNEEVGMELINDPSCFVDTMISILSDRQNPANDFKLQHALLGALRNFAVTSSARSCLIQKGILFPCMSLFDRLNMSTPAFAAVVFKLLGTLRLLVEGHPEAVTTLIENRDKQDVVAKLVQWGSPAESPQGIRAECGRLLAAMIKNCRTKEGLKYIVNSGGLPPVTFMLHSSHVRMLNEAIVALAVLSATLTTGACDESDDDAIIVHRNLHIDLVINGIKRCFCPEEGSGLQVHMEVKVNAITLLENLIKVRREDFKQMLTDLKLLEDCLNDDALKLLPPQCGAFVESLKK